MSKTFHKLNCDVIISILLFSKIKKYKDSLRAENSSSIFSKEAVMLPVPSLRGGGAGEAFPLTTAYPPLFLFTQITVFGTSRNCKTTTMTLKGFITFKHNSPISFLDSLRNCWQPTAVHKSDEVI